MPCAKIHSKPTLKTPESSTDDTAHNESWLFRILSRAVAFGELLPQNALPKGHNTTATIMNLINRDLSNVEPPSQLSKDLKPPVTQVREECSIQRWLAFRASAFWSEKNSGVSLAGPLEKERARLSFPPLTSDPVSKTPHRTPDSDAEISAFQEIPKLTCQQKLTLIVNELGPLAKENEEEQLLAESEASFFQDVAILVSSDLENFDPAL